LFTHPFVDLKSTKHKVKLTYLYIFWFFIEIFKKSKVLTATMKIRKITIIRGNAKPIKTLNDELQWLGSSLGLFNLRDRDSSCFRLFIELVKASKNDRMLSSDELAYRLNLSRGTVIHHINRMADSGIVISQKRRYALRVDSLKSLIDELEKDIHSSMAQIKEVAKDIDRELGL